MQTRSKSTHLQGISKKELRQEIRKILKETNRVIINPELLKFRPLEPFLKPIQKLPVA